MPRNPARSEGIIFSNFEFSSPEILYLQSICLEYGLGRSISHQNSLKQLQHAFEMSQSQSSSSQLCALILCELGYEYLLGARVPLNERKAYECFFKGHTLDPDQPALSNNLGYCLLNGIGVVADPVKASELFLRSALQGNINSQHNFGYCLQHIGKSLVMKCEENSPLYWFRLSADSGSSDSQFRLGYCYQYGLEGLPINISEAVRFYTQSANQYNSFGQYCLASCHQRHLVHRHYTKSLQEDGEKTAFNLYLASACQGNPYGLHGLGQCFQHGIGVKRNIIEANRIYSLVNNSHKVVPMGDAANFLNLSPPHLCYHNHLICHPTYHTLSSSRYPNLVLKTHQPHYLWEIVCQFGYVPYVNILQESAKKGCLISAGFLLHLYLEDIQSSDETTLELMESRPQIVEELSSWLALLGENSKEHRVTSPQFIAYSYLKSYLISASQDGVDIQHLECLYPIPLPKFLHQFSEEYQLTLSNLDDSSPAHYDYCLYLLLKTPQEPSIPELFLKLRKSAYLPSRALVAICFYHGVQGYEKNLTMALEYGEICSLYGMKRIIEYGIISDPKKE